MRPVTLTLISIVADSDDITTTQVLAAPGNLTINGDLAAGGVATIPQPSYVSITSSGNDSGVIWTVTGTDGNGVALVESLAGSNGGAATTIHRFKTVTQIHGSVAAAANVIAGTAAFAYSEPCPVDYHPAPINIGLFFSTNGSTTAFKVQYSGDDPWDYADADTFNANGTWFDHASLTALTAKASGSIVTPVRAVRLQSNQAGTDTGTLKIVEGGL
jgi:hypothetical protein